MSDKRSLRRCCRTGKGMGSRRATTGAGRLKRLALAAGISTALALPAFGWQPITNDGGGASLSLSEFVHSGATNQPAPRAGRGPSPPELPPIDLNQDVRFASGTTIDLPDLTQRVGRLRGFVIVRVQGEPLLMPVFTVTGDPRLFRILADAPICAGTAPSTPEP